MPRMLRRIIAVAVLLGAWALVGSDRAPIPLTMGSAEASQGWNGSPSQKEEKAPHELAALRVFTKVVISVKENYVDPKRVKPKEMMISALEYVEKSVPDVLVEGNAETGKLALNVNGKQKEFDISHVDSLWKMSFTMKDVFEFISKNMRSIDDTRDIEIAAVNGMLATLDPHSQLLRPEVYGEMKLSTKGEFGGLGFVIQMRDCNLTVVKVLPKTPAHRAGIQKDDQIKKIGDESTVGMELNKAVGKLRGPIGSQVTITVDRKGWDKPKVMVLTRAKIEIESVQHKLLAQNVGYVRLKNFQGNTTRDLETALEELQKQSAAKGSPMKGLVLDLRGNPGGLLEQAIQVSDTFLSKGVIVATVGLSDKLREEKRARATDGEEAYPIAVLVNAGSASASEIVAGALKNLDRAVVIGRQTFGKGSVQVLYDYPDDSALKLTIAKYLTPGDKSIQEVGIVPDIQLVPTRVTAKRLDVFAPRRSMGEADLDQHFGNPDSDKVAKKREEVLDREKPLESFQYLKVDEQPAAQAAAAKKELKAPKPVTKDVKECKDCDKDPVKDIAELVGEDLDDQLDAESQDEIKEDFEVTFAREFVLKAPSSNRQEQLRQAKPFIDQKRLEEEQNINSALTALGIDWSPGPTPKNVQLESSLSPSSDQSLRAGETLDLVVTAMNKGTEPLKRVRAWTESENDLINRKEFVFGSLAPGEKKSWKVQVKLPKNLVARRDEVTVRFFDENGELPKALVSELNFLELPRPTFAFNWQVLDDCPTCNGDGMAERGETINLVLDVTNTGTGAASDAVRAEIRSAGDPNVFIEKGCFKLSELAPGETKSARFQLEVKKGYAGKSFPLKLVIMDGELDEYLLEKLEVPLRDTPLLSLTPAKTHVKLAEKTELLVAPLQDARPLARVSGAPAVLPVLATGKGYYKVALSEDRFAFVRSADAREQKAAKTMAPKKLEWMARLAPPAIELEVDTSRGGVMANGERFTLSGSVTDPNGLLDMYVLVNDQKVYFKAVDPKGEEPKKLKFTTEFALQEGNNSILVVARETPDFASRKTLVVRRRPETVAQKLPMPAPAQPQKTP